MSLKKNVPTLIEQASQNVPGFSQMYEKFLKKLTINGYSQSTISGYGRSIAKVSIHFGKVPLQLDDEQIEDYLFFY